MMTLTPIVSHHGAKATQQAASRLPQLYKSRLPRNLALAASTCQVLPLRKPYGKSLPGFLNSNAVVLHNDNDDPNPTQPITKLSPTLAENKIVSPPSPHSAMTLLVLTTCRNSQKPSLLSIGCNADRSLITASAPQYPATPPGPLLLPPLPTKPTNLHSSTPPHCAMTLLVF